MTSVVHLFVIAALLGPLALLVWLRTVAAHRADALARHLRALADALEHGADPDTVDWSLPVGPSDGLGRAAEAANRLAGAVAGSLRQHRALEAGQAEQVATDPLTSVASRWLLRGRLDHALAISARLGNLVGVIALDIDRLGVVNDALGPAAGDEVLVEVASRLRRTLRAADTVGRLGGDEFAVLVEHQVSEGGLHRVVERVRQALAEPFTTGGRTMTLTASMGVAMGTGVTESADRMLEDAEVALRVAKRRGAGHVEYADPELRERRLRLAELELALRVAVDRHELQLAYQPMVDVATGRLSGLEALLRWHRPDVGPVPPDEFVPVAEECGLIDRIGAWVLLDACRQLTAWQRSWPAARELTMSVNVSARQLARPDFVDEVAAALADSGLEPHRLLLEVAEGVVVDDPDRVRGHIERLKRLGVAIAIDGFGVGYASLGFLRSFPVDLVKIDRRFVVGLDADDTDARVVSAIIELCHGLGFEVLGEGVETSEQRDHLAGLGCDLAQGLHYARPLGPSQVETFLASGRVEPVAGRAT